MAIIWGKIKKAVSILEWIIAVGGVLFGITVIGQTLLYWNTVEELGFNPITRTILGVLIVGMFWGILYLKKKERKAKKIVGK